MLPVPLSIVISKIKERELQSHSNQVNLVLALEQTHRLAEESRESRYEPKHIWSINI